MTVAFRVSDLVVDGEIDNTQKGRVTGWIQFSNRSDRVTLNLKGDCQPDLAGWRFRVKRLRPVPEWADPSDAAQLTAHQTGDAGTITASHRVNDPDCSPEELVTRCRLGEPPPSVWRDALYLEWFSRTNGRVVIEDTRLGVDLVGERAFELTEDDMRRKEEEALRKLEELDAEGWTIEEAVPGSDFGFVIRKRDENEPHPDLQTSLDEQTRSLDRAVRQSLRECEEELEREWEEEQPWRDDESEDE